jgi:hypothetical protein
VISTIDYTKMRRNSRIAGHYIAVCPKCGKKGLCFIYHKKRVNVYMHEGKRTLEGVEVTKSCQVTIDD